MSKSRNTARPRDLNAAALTRRGGGGFHKSHKSALEDAEDVRRVRQINSGDLSALLDDDELAQLDEDIAYLESFDDSGEDDE